MNILTVVGARPQFIKASAVSRAIQNHGEGLVETLVHTGQHFDDNMSKVFFQQLGIPQPDCNLGITHPTHGGMTGRMLEQLDELMQQRRPDCVLVYGDTNSTLAGALAAAKLNIPVAHVEAGLRSFNRRMPEEINRVMTDHLAEFLFAPTELAMSNLASEGIKPGDCHQTGDVMYDVALHYAEQAERESQVLADLDVQPGQYFLATVHRQENTDDAQRLQTLFEALCSLDDLPVVLPLHPRTRAVLDRLQLLDEITHRLKVLPPQGYLDMLQLERNAALVLTDSGGIQKEAFFFAVPCITLRTETEWVELVELGWNRLAPQVDGSTIAALVADTMAHPGRTGQPYGSGNAATAIVSVLAGQSG